jgi:hypothetical protein
MTFKEAAGFTAQGLKEDLPLAKSIYDNLPVKK